MDLEEEVDLEEGAVAGSGAEVAVEDSEEVVGSEEVRLTRSSICPLLYSTIRSWFQTRRQVVVSLLLTVPFQSLFVCAKEVFSHHMYT